MNEKTLQGPLTRAALFHDLSGFGKCSLTTALPILSAAGIEGCCIPTAILSTHTGGFTDYTFHDLTEDLPAYLAHWQSLGIVPDAVYSGYMGSPEQAEILLDFVAYAKQKNKDTIFFADPVMGDNGELYPGFDETMVQAMKRLCKKADIILPNMTEASALLGLEWHAAPYTKDELKKTAQALAALGPQTVIITGASLAEGMTGAAVYTADDQELSFYETQAIPGAFHGTGDVFSSFVLGGLLNDLPIRDAVADAAELTKQAIARTVQRATPAREGVDFEGTLPAMMKRFGIV